MKKDEVHHEEARHRCWGEGEGGREGSVDEEVCVHMCQCEGEGCWGGWMDELEDHDDMCGVEWVGGGGGLVDKVCCDTCGGGGGGMSIDDASNDISELGR